MAAGRLHPGIRRQNRERRGRGADGDQDRGQDVEPRGEAVPAEQQDSEEGRFEKEGGDHLVADQRADHVADHHREAAPVGAELVAEHDPQTTPIAKDTAKILVQNRASRCRCSSPLHIQRTNSVAMKAESPMVKLGKMMWNAIVKANCSLARRQDQIHRTFPITAGKRFNRAGIIATNRPAMRNGIAPGTGRFLRHGIAHCPEAVDKPPATHGSRGISALWWCRSRPRGRQHGREEPEAVGKGAGKIGWGKPMTDTRAPAGEQSLLDRYFGLTQSGTNVRTEFIAGVTTFLTMVYIVFVNPQILGAAGMDKGAVFVATCLAGGDIDLIMALLRELSDCACTRHGAECLLCFHPGN